MPSGAGPGDEVGFVTVGMKVDVVGAVPAAAGDGDGCDEV
jgi:hypothetical protein